MLHGRFPRRACAGGLALVAMCLFSAANTGPITRLMIDKAAPLVPLFDGIAAEQFQVRMVANDAYQSSVFITNLTPSTLNVALPKAAVGVNVLPQVGFFGQNNGGNNNPFGANNPFGGAIGQNQNGLGGGNKAQGVGGQMQPAGIFGNANPGINGVGTGFPSIPPEWAEKVDAAKFGGIAAVPAGKTIRLQMRTVCLNYGRPDPSSSLPYQLVSVERFSSDPVLAELLESYSPRVDQDVMQAAAWHVANGLSWQQLARLADQNVPYTSATLFTAKDIRSAQAIVQSVQQQAAKREKTIVAR